MPSTPKLKMVISATKALTKDASVKVFRGKPFTISVTNNHHSNHHTKLHKFVHESGQPVSPIDDTKGKPEVAAQSQQTRETTVTIKADALKGKYTYTATIDNVDFDPDLVVEDPPP